MLIITSHLSIPESELEFSFSRSSGPGGQNVNKVNSKAHLRWNLFSSTALIDSERQRILARLGKQLTVEGDLLVTSDRHRDQKMNRQDCVEKFIALLQGALAVQKRRKETKPSRSSIRKAKNKNQRHSEKKKQRGKVQF